jgi:hypothetical protein
MVILVKEIRINVRTTADIKRDLETTAKLRGLTVSSLVNSLAVTAIREEKNLEPDAFRAATAPPVKLVKVESIGEMTDESKPKKIRKTG